MLAAQRLYDDTQNAVGQGTQAPVLLTSAGAQLASSRQDYINSEGLVLQQELLLKESPAAPWNISSNERSTDLMTSFLERLLKQRFAFSPEQDL